MPVASICAQASALHLRLVSTCQQNGVLGVHPSGAQKSGSRMVLNPYCGENEGEQSTSLLQLLFLCADWCAVWHCHEGVLYSFSCLEELFEIFV